MRLNGNNSKSNRQAKPAPNSAQSLYAPTAAAQLLRLQKTAGNKAVVQLLKENYPAQRKIIFNDTGEEYTQKYSKKTKALKDQLQDQFGNQWKRGWISYLQERIGKDKDYAYDNLQGLVQDIANRFPAAPSNAPEVVDRLIQAFKEEDRGVVGFIWTVAQKDIELSDGSLFTKRDLIDALHTKQGRELIDGQWRDSSGSKRMDQTIQGQHEWILTSDIGYVIEHCKSVEDVALWFSAAEMLRTPTKNVIFDFKLGKKDLKKIKKGKVDNFSELGLLSAHAGGIYAERDDDDEKKKDKRKYNVQISTFSGTFHNQLHELLTRYLNKQKNDLAGYLHALKQFQQEMVWDGYIKRLKKKEAKLLTPGFFTGTNKDSPEVAPNMEKFMLLQQERYQQDVQIMENRTNAILSDLNLLLSQAKGMKLAIDTGKLRELDDDVRTTLELQFNELDQTMNQVWPRMREDYLNSHSAKDMEQQFSLLQAEWEKRYNEYIQLKVRLLDEAHQFSMSKLNNE